MRELRFSVSTKRRYESVVCLSVCPSVGRSVRPHVMLLLFGVLGANFEQQPRILGRGPDGDNDLWNHPKQATIIFIFFAPPNGL